MRVRVVDDDGTVRTRVGNGFHAYSEFDLATETPLENPIDVAWHPDGRLCVLLLRGRVICLDTDDTICPCRDGKHRGQR